MYTHCICQADVAAVFNLFDSRQHTTKFIHTAYVKETAGVHALLSGASLCLLKCENL